MTNLKRLSAEEQSIILARRAYKKEWRAKNKDKVKAANDRFYKKQDERLANQKSHNEETA